jgi:repressor LexA
MDGTMNRSKPTLTKRQKQVYDFIRKFVELNGHSPSYSEIAGGLGLSAQSTIHGHVRNLIKKGYITAKWNANRSIDLNHGQTEEPDFASLPMAGTIAAGAPIEAIEQTEMINVPSELVGKGANYILQVRGDSMEEDHVLDGDMIIVEKRGAPKDGDMVVALLRGSDATLKRYKRRGKKIILYPANPAYEPIETDEQDLVIQGVVIGLLRKY